MDVQLRSAKVVNRRIARLPGVQNELKKHAHGIAFLAEIILAPHRKTGSHHIEVQKIRNVRFGHIDYFVSFVGPAAYAVETGHWHNFTGQWVEGLHVLELALKVHGG